MDITEKLTLAQNRWFSGASYNPGEPEKAVFLWRNGAPVKLNAFYERDHPTSEVTRSGLTVIHGSQHDGDINMTVRDQAGNENYLSGFYIELDEASNSK